MAVLPPPRNGARVPRAAAIAPLLVAFCLGPLGCGAGGPSKDRFISRADTICRDQNRQLQLLGLELTPVGVRRHDLPSIAVYLARLVGVFDGHLRRIERLPRPSDDRSKLDRILRGLRSEVESDDAARHAASVGDLRSFRRAVRAGQSLVPFVERLARSYGFRVCAQRY